MALVRYTASADTTITNAFEANLRLRGTGSNMGYADSMAVFSIYGQVSGSTGQSQELSRALIKFPIASITSDRTAGSVPASGSVSFYLKMYNAETPFTLPQDFNLVVAPVSRSWSEGTGLDMDNYQDLGDANWINASASNAWTAVGGDYLTASNYNVAFPLGYENIELDVSQIVEQWIADEGNTPAEGVITNYGFGIRLTASQEAFFSNSSGVDDGSLIHNVVGARQSYYIKKFFSRSTEFFFKRPVIEARWDSSTKDNRGNFYYSSSLAPAADNLNTLYRYNYIRGQLVNIPAVGTGNILVSIYSGSVSASAPTGSKLTLPAGAGVVGPDYLNITASWSATGIYTASFAVTAASTPLETLYDVWHAGGVEYFTGSINPTMIPIYDHAPTFERDTNVKNLRKSYSSSETARFRLFIRNKNWSPTIYTVATAINPTDIIESGAFAINRVVDNLEVIPYGTGSDLHTMLSYDLSGNYFDLNMSLLEAGYMYRARLSYYNDSIGDWVEQPYTFKFRVE